MGGIKLSSSAISVEEIVHIVKKRFGLLLFMGLLGLAISSVITFVVVTPKYDATTQLLINKVQKGDSVNPYQETQTDLQLMNTYIAIVKSDVILDEAIRELNLSMDVKKLKESLTVASEENSKVMNISIRSTDPVESVTIANKIAEIFKQKTPGLIEVKNVQILSQANLKNAFTPVSPNVGLNLAAGALLGIIAGGLLIAILELTDHTFKSEREIEEYLEVPVIGSIHQMNNAQKRKLSKQTVNTKPPKKNISKKQKTPIWMSTLRRDKG